MPTSWNLTLVIVSIIVSIVGSFTALTHAQRMRDSATNRGKRLWMLTGAATLGLTIWSMHFIGMLAFQLPITLSYNPLITLLSIGPATVAALLGFYILRTPSVVHSKIGMASLIMGLGIATMHYMGMAALKMSPSISYQPLYFIASVTIAIVASWAALMLMYHGEHIKLPPLIRLILSSVIMGLAIASMHYTAMQGLGIPAGSLCLAGASPLNNNILAMLVALTAIFGFGIGNVVAYFDRRTAISNEIALTKLQDLHANLEFSAHQQALKMTQELRDHERKMQAIINGALDCIVSADRHGHIIEFNPAAEKVFGHSRQSVLGKRLSEIIIPLRYRALHEQGFKHYQETGRSTIIGHRIEVSALRADGSEFPAELTLSATYNKSGTEVTSFMRDITEQKKSDADIHHLAFYDSLTQLPNRRLLSDRLKCALSAGSRHKKYGAVLFMDLDKFKNLNDTRGHAIGDLLLIEVARRLRSCVRNQDTVARLGGDEFIAVIEGLNTHEEKAILEVKAFSEKIQRILSEPYELQNIVHIITLSIGICLFHDKKSAVDELLKHADNAMYHAKQAGRNTMRFYNPEMQTAIEKHAKLEQDLRHAFAQNQFALYYQPQVQLDAHPSVNSSAVIVSAEVLLRWIHPTRGVVLPLEFITIAEETGLIHEIGHWVLKTACAQLKQWACKPETEHLTLSVNVSTRQFRESSFVESLQRILQTTSITPNKLKLEFTESLILDNIEESIVKMHALRNMGILFSIDDFGTGYSSLSYLKRLPLTQLKIDRSFVKDITVDTQNETIIETIILMAHSLGMEVIAEGVETAAQVEFLRKNNCQTFQGYFFSIPMPIDVFNQQLDAASTWR